MIGDLEYFMVSLPYLTFNDSAEVRQRVSKILEVYTGSEVEEKGLLEMLNEEAEKFLSASDYKLFLKIGIDKIHRTAFRESSSRPLAAFSAYTHKLRESVSKLRKARQSGINLKNEGDDGFIALEGTPLDQEIALMKYQWDKLESLAVGNYANFDALIIYKLKLMLLLRWWNFDRERGFQRFAELLKSQ